MPVKSSPWEVADIFRKHGQAYRGAHRMPLAHLKVMHAITSCRTPQMGGHIERCDKCGYERSLYHSCRNRHCPKCQTLSKARWLEARLADLLPVRYFHTVFTVPHSLNALMLCNKEVMLGILFKAVSQTLLAFGRNNLGGKLGFIAILHTWDQVLMDHFHLHCVVPAGVLTEDGNRWISNRSKGYLFPVRALSRVFRGKFITLLEQARRAGRLKYHGRSEIFSTSEGFARLISELRSQPWVVFSKQPFAGPKQVLDYLGRYTHRVAISNHRLLHGDDHSVTFSYQDRRDNNTRKEMTLSPDEFIRRFLLHVLPQGFMRIRSFGFLANRTKKQSLGRIRILLACAPQPRAADKSTRMLMLELTGLDIDRCPSCGAEGLRVVAKLQPSYSSQGEPLPALPAALNSS